MDSFSVVAIAYFVSPFATRFNPFGILPGVDRFCVLPNGPGFPARVEVSVLVGAFGCNRAHLQRAVLSLLGFF